VSYSEDLRQRVVDFVREGGSKVEASRLFNVSRWCVYDWLKRENDLAGEKTGPKGCWKLDTAKLVKLVEENPEAYLSELAEELGTGISTVWYRLNSLKISRKKNHTVQRARRK
jgi:putative transposase